MGSDLVEEPRDWLIRKDGYYYRPNCQGYTTRKVDAGRYTKTKADAECAVEPWHMTAIHQDEVPDEPAIASLAARITELEAALAAVTAELDEARRWATEWHRICETICTILGLGILDANEIVGAVRAKFEAAEAEAARLREALVLCQRNLAALVEPSVISGTTVIAAYSGCREAEAKARAALGGEHG